MLHLPKQSVGGGIGLSALHTQRLDAANYICLVLIYPSVCLSMVVAASVPSSDVRRRVKQPRLYSPHSVNTSLRKGAAVKVSFQLCVGRREEVGIRGPLGSKPWGRRQPELQPRNEAFML